MRQSTNQPATASLSTPKGLRIGLSLSQILLAAALLTTGCASGARVPVAQTSHPGQLLFNGHTKPEVDCFSCHNGDATGAGMGPDLSEAVAEHSDAELSAIISDGPGFMPSYDEELTAEEKTQIIAWLRTRFPAAL